MKRRYFLAWGLGAIPYALLALGVDYRKSRPEAWTASSINDAALALYGKNTFATIQKSAEIELTVPKPIVKDPENIPISIRSSIEAKTVAIFQDANPKSLVAVFDVGEGGVVSYGLTIRMEFKGTLFAVVEGLDGKLYYTREYIDILTMSCMASGG